MKETGIGFFSVGITGAFDAKTAAANFKAGLKSFKKMVGGVGLHAVACEEIIYTKKRLREFLSLCTEQGIGALVIHTSSFTSGELGQEAAYYASEHRMPVIIWAVPEPEGGPLTCNNLCCANFLASIFYSMDVPYKWVSGAPGDADVTAALTETMIVARTIEKMKSVTMGVVGGGRVPGFFGSNFDEVALKTRFGVSVRRLTISEFYSAFKAAKPARIKSAVQKIKDSATKCAKDAGALERSARAFVALKEVAAANECDSLAVRCWPELREDLDTDPCLPMALLGDEGLLCSCEGDVPGLLTMMYQFELTRRTQGPPALLDMVSLDAKLGSVGLWHCGIASPSLCDKASLCAVRHSIVMQDNPRGKMGLTLESTLKAGPVTVCRFQDPGAGRYLAVEGKILARKARFRGSYAEFKPESMSAADLLCTVMSQGVTHHYSLARSYHMNLIDETAYWLGLEKIETVSEYDRDSHFGRV